MDRIAFERILILTKCSNTFYKKKHDVMTMSNYRTAVELKLIWIFQERNQVLREMVCSLKLMHNGYFHCQLNSHDF